MTKEFILAGIGVFGLIYSLIKNGKKQKIISLLLAIGLLLPLLENIYINIFSNLIILSAAILSIVYSIRTRGVSILSRIYIGISGVLFTLITLTTMLPINSTRELQLTMLIPLVLFALSFILYKKGLPNEFGFMLIWAILSLFEFIKYFGFY